jgi:hypothetical protein
MNAYTNAILAACLILALAGVIVGAWISPPLYGVASLAAILSGYGLIIHKLHLER